MEDYNEDQEQDCWEATIAFDYLGLKTLYDHLEYSIQMWPGSPARPAQEQEFLRKLKYSVYAAMMDHTFTELNDE